LANRDLARQLQSMQYRRPVPAGVWQSGLMLSVCIDAG
jgi:hypothetical protein